MLTRRKFILSAASVIAVSIPGRRSSALKKDFLLSTSELRIPPVISGGDMTIAHSETFQVFPGSNTGLITINGSFPGPTIRVKKGDTFSAKIINDLGGQTVIHWHGLHAPALMDGHPKYPIDPGKTFDVSYPINQRAGTYFYHSHLDMATALQTYKGIAGMFIIEDDEEKALHLPSGEFEIPLLIQDKRFDASKQLVYTPTENDMATGWLGDTVLINGTPNANLTVKQTLYRFRLVNGSNARIYNIALSDGKSFTIIGNDGGLLEAPVNVSSVLLAPAERLDILVDFSGYEIGATMNLKSLVFTYNGDPGFPTLPQGSEMSLMQFTVGQTGPLSTPPPNKLSVIEKYQLADKKNDRRFEFGGSMYINFKSFSMDRIDQKVTFGDLEQWTFVNQSEHTHPIHVHGTQFQIIDRNSLPPDPWEAGWKDVVRLDPAQSINVLVRFADYTGIYLIHCHNLEHEDMGMMSNFQVIDTGAVKPGEASSPLEIYPNPAKDYAMLTFPPLAEDTLLLLCDEKGSIIHRAMLSGGANQYALVTRGYSSGVYYLSVGSFRRNLVVHH
jgi:FtsP/CotA-like multicopper oxidase with cupredoxin domain